VKPLEAPDVHYVRAAEGWLELGCPGQANQELRKLTPQSCSHPDVLEVLWQVYARAKLWNACVEIGSTLLELDPGRASGWLRWAYALRRAAGDGLRVAWVALLPAAEKFPELPPIPFNLACYAAQMGRLAEARGWLNRALAIAERAGHQNRLWLRALYEPDLDLLWQGIGSIGHESFPADPDRLIGFKS
jgi:tetratricopeptide (TPR) repeat protein